MAGRVMGLALPVEMAATAIRYRLSRDEDGPAIGALFKAADHGDLGADWTTARVGAGWLLAERDGALIGAIQLLVGHPYSVIGDCVVHPGARARTQDGRGQFGTPGEVTLMLYAGALKLLGQTGSQIAVGVTKKAGMARIIGRYGGIPLGRCESFARGLRP